MDFTKSSYGLITLFLLVLGFFEFVIGEEALTSPDFPGCVRFPWHVEEFYNCYMVFMNDINTFRAANLTQACCYLDVHRNCVLTSLQDDCPLVNERESLAYSMLYYQSLKVLKGLDLTLEDCFGFAGVGGLPTYSQQVDAKYELCVNAPHATFKMTLFAGVIVSFMGILVALGVALVVWRKVKATREHFARMSNIRLSVLQANV